MLKIIGIFIIITIILSYLPIDAMGHCPEEDHHTGTRMDCGYVFHCPVLHSPNVLDLSTLTLNSWLKRMVDISKIEELPNFIFHPPKNNSNIN
jgi:hypothetical protein